jgi:hypothetical protein
MPEAAVHVNGEFGAAKHDVGGPTMPAMAPSGLKMLGGEAQDCLSALGSVRGASVVKGAVVRRDGRQALRFGRLQQPSVVDAEGREGVPVGVRSRQVYRI